MSYISINCEFSLHSSVFKVKQLKFDLHLLLTNRSRDLPRLAAVRIEIPHSEDEKWTGSEAAVIRGQFCYQVMEVTQTLVIGK